MDVKEVEVEIKRLLPDSYKIFSVHKHPAAKSKIEIRIAFGYSTEQENLESTKDTLFWLMKSIEQLVLQKTFDAVHELRCASSRPVEVNNEP